MTMHRDIKEAWDRGIELQGLIQAAELVAFHTDGAEGGNGALLAVLNAADRLARDLNMQLERIERLAKRAEASS